MLARWLVLAAIATALGAASAAGAGAPTQAVRETSDKIIGIVTDESLKPPERHKERNAKIRAAVDERFDWTEFARRSLGRYWLQRTPQEKAHFIRIFSDLIERTYMDRVDAYKGQPINYLSETVDGKYALVKVTVAESEKGGTVIPVEYRLMLKGSEWMVYDVVAEGVSLVNNYRTQFSDILSSSSYAKLVARIEAKLKEKRTE